MESLPVLLAQDKHICQQWQSQIPQCFGGLIALNVQLGWFSKWEDTQACVFRRSTDFVAYEILWSYSKFYVYFCKEMFANIELLPELESAD